MAKVNSHNGRTKAYLYQWTNLSTDFDTLANLGKIGGTGVTANRLRGIEDNLKEDLTSPQWIVAARRKQGIWRVAALLKVRLPTSDESKQIGKLDKYLYFDEDESGFMGLSAEDSVENDAINRALIDALPGQTQGQNGLGFEIAEDTIDLLKSSIKLTIKDRKQTLSMATSAGSRIENATELANNTTHESSASSNQLEARAERLLGLLADRLPTVVPGDPRTYVSYKEVHASLGLEQLGPTYGESLKSQGLTSLAEWTRAENKPAITGLIIDQSTMMLGDGYFLLFKKRNEDFKWWQEQVRLAKEFDWNPYISKPDSSEVPVDPGINPGIPPNGRRAISMEEFIKREERKSEIGADGERIALKDEMQRIRDCGCPDPEAYVRQISLDDVGRGYDIESTWPDEERCIEVKASTQGADGFYISKNERRVLFELGARAWIYLVVLNPDGQGRVVKMFPDPIKHLSEHAFDPMYWRVTLQ